MNKYNKLKQKTLAVFADKDGDWIRPHEIANSVNFRPRRTAWTYLKRLRRFGLLEERSYGKGTLQYRITRAGTARLEWIRARNGTS
jgi:DNA-binding IclR family transcriptional regulator